MYKPIQNIYYMYNIWLRNKSHSKLAMELKIVNPNASYSAGSRLIDVPINYQSKFYDLQTITSISCKPVVYTGLPHNRIIANKLDSA